MSNNNISDTVMNSFSIPIKIQIEIIGESIRKGEERKRNILTAVEISARSISWLKYLKRLV